MSVSEVVYGLSWVTLTPLNHPYTLLNMIIHLGGRVPLNSLLHRIQSFQSKLYFLIEMEEPFHLIAKDRHF